MSEVTAVEAVAEIRGGLRALFENQEQRISVSWRPVFTVGSPSSPGPDWRQCQVWSCEVATLYHILTLASERDVSKALRDRLRGLGGCWAEFQAMPDSGGEPVIISTRSEISFIFSHSLAPARLGNGQRRSPAPSSLLQRLMRE